MVADRKGNKLPPRRSRREAQRREHEKRANAATAKRSIPSAQQLGAAKASKPAAKTPQRKSVGPIAGPTKVMGKKPVKKPAQKPVNPIWRWVKRIGLGIFTLFLIGVIAASTAFLLAYWRIEIPDPDQSAQAQISTVYFADGKTQIGTLGEQNRAIIDTTTLPPYVGQAVVASEDRTFFENNGVDLRGIARALWNNVQGKPRQGASTLSQQYVERYYTGTNATYLSKFRETILALKINRTQSKEEILNNYLNTIYFGRNSYGIEAASQAYFAKPAQKLTLAEAAMLAGIIPAPSAYDPAVNIDAAKTRFDRVLKLMVEDGWVSAAEAKAAKFPEVLPPTKRKNFLKGPNGYLVNQVRTELETQLGYKPEQIDTLGIKIVTTIDAQKQQQLIDAVQATPEDRPEGLRMAATAIDPSTGGIVAEYAGEDYQKIQSNAATQDIAMAGSTFKTFTLLAALEAGHKLTDIYNGNSVVVDGKTIDNYGGYQYGNISLKAGLVYSVNGVYVRLNQDIGPENTRRVAISAGIPEKTIGLADNPTNTLGTASPHNIDLASAYATFAADGVHRKPHLIDRIQARSGDELYHWTDDGEQVFDRNLVAQLNEALYAVGQADQKYTGYYGRFGAKTGSAENNRAAQFVGFVPELSTAISFYQVGPDGSEQPITPFGGVNEVLGNSFPAQVWGRWMNSLGMAQIPNKQGIPGDYVR